MLDEGFVCKRVNELLLQARNRGPLRPPIDPGEIAAFCSVLSVENRKMIPEGVLAPVRGGFKVFLQENFVADPGVRIRRRFTLAHELAHTFFYRLENDLPKPIKGAPRGARLERLCQFGASQILLPDILLKQQFQSRKVTCAEDLLGLAKAFDVSLEVVFRRIHKMGFVADDEFAAALVDKTEEREIIQAACYGPLLLCNLPAPKRGMDFEFWVKPLRTLDVDLGSQTPITTRTADIRTRRVQRSRRSYIFEMRFAAPTRTR